jgi:hypothetical protein
LIPLQAVSSNSASTASLEIVDMDVTQLSLYCGFIGKPIVLQCISYVYNAVFLEQRKIISQVVADQIQMYPILHDLELR